MKNLLFFKRLNHKSLPYAIIIGTLFVAGSISYAFSPLSPLVKKQAETSVAIASHVIKPTQAETPTPSVSGSPKETVLGAQTNNVSPQPTVTKTPAVQQASSPTTTQSNIVSGTSSNNTPNTVLPTQTPISQQATPTPTQSAAAATVSVEIKSPDGSSSFSVEYNSGMNVCDVLQKGKEAGKIRSVTFDDSYMATLHSKYVSEINGFANNWTFSVNGSSPLGCSLAQPKPNDTIVWKFG